MLNHNSANLRSFISFTKRSRSAFYFMKDLKMSLLDAIKTQAQITDKVLVSFSMGKDSIVTLDLCMKYFKQVQPFFMYLVPDLKF